MGAEGEITITVTTEGTVRIRVTGAARVVLDGAEVHSIDALSHGPREMSVAASIEPSAPVEAGLRKPVRAHLRAERARPEPESRIAAGAQPPRVRTLLFGSTWAATHRRRESS